MSDRRDETLAEIAAPLEELKGYLTTDIQVGEPRAIDAKWRGADHAANVSIAVANTAPEVRSPRVVFVGIGLSLIDLRLPNASGGPPRWAREVRRVRSDAPEPDRNLRVQLAGEAFPLKTRAEQTLGEILFPGDTVTYEMDVPADELPHAQFRVEGSISRRHLLYVGQELPPLA